MSPQVLLHDEGSGCSSGSVVAVSRSNRTRAGGHEGEESLEEAGGPRHRWRTGSDRTVDQHFLGRWRFLPEEQRKRSRVWRSVTFRRPCGGNITDESSLAGGQGSSQGSYLLWSGVMESSAASGGSDRESFSRDTGSLQHTHLRS